VQHLVMRGADDKATSYAWIGFMALVVTLLCFREERGSHETLTILLTLSLSEEDCGGLEPFTAFISAAQDRQ